MFNKTKYWIGKIAGILAILLGLSFIGNLLWVLGIQGSVVSGGAILLTLILNILLIIIPAIVCVVCGMGLFAKPRFCSDDPARPLWLFVSNAKVIVLIAFCFIICLTSAIGTPIGNFFAWFKVKPVFDIKFFSLFDKFLDKPQTIIRWFQIISSFCALALSVVFLFLRPMVAAKETLDESTEVLDGESNE
ncbi:MAG: hypothetical protein E7352_05785 [Clostridiales bacterium]|nr:hypothetical protein [Clostridiales bacterium]